MKEITLKATVENIEAVTEFIEQELEAALCPPRAVLQLLVVVDELFGNIAHYAYAPETGEATVRIDFTENEPAAIITFIDSGMPFNPLEAPDPDISAGVSERAIGGLGIFMVKKTVDDITYAYRDGCNILTVRKNFRQSRGGAEQTRKLLHTVQ